MSLPNGRNLSYLGGKPPGGATGCECRNIRDSENQAFERPGLPPQLPLPGAVVLGVDPPQVPIHRAGRVPPPPGFPPA